MSMRSRLISRRQQVGLSAARVQLPCTPSVWIHCFVSADWNTDNWQNTSIKIIVGTDAAMYSILALESSILPTH